MVVLVRFAILVSILDMQGSSVETYMGVFYVSALRFAVLRYL